MSPAGGVLGTLFRTEMRMLLRDRRTLFVSVVVPLAIWPAMIFLMSWTESREQERIESTTLEYAVGGSRADWARARVAEGLERLGEGAGAESPGARLVERPAVDPEALLEAGDLDLVVQGLSHAEWRTLESSQRAEPGPGGGVADATAPAGPDAGDPDATAGAGRDATARAGSDAGDPDATAGAAAEADATAAGPEAAGPGDAAGTEPSLPVIRLLYRDNSGLSSTAMRRVRDGLQALRAERREGVFRERGFPVDLDRVAAVELSNVASAGEEAGAILGMALTPVIVLLMLSGGSIVAVDAISGEKERGTLETLLTTAASRWEIVGAKQMAIVVVGLAIAAINVANLLAYLALGVIELPVALADLSVTPLDAVVLLLLYVPLAVLISSILLLVSGYSKSYKEYQIYFFPIFLILMLPAAAAVLPGIDLRSVVAVVPVAGVSVATREVLSGELDWLFLGLCFASTAAVAAWLSRLTIRTLSTERLITASELDRADLEGGPALFPRHVLQWFAVMWVILLVGSSWLGADLGITGQVVVNILGIFLGGSLLMLWRYRLDVRRALALRPVPPAVWIAVLIGAPSGFLTGQAVFQLADLVFPVPRQMMEAFGQFLAPEDLPLWQVVVMLCVLPGVVEEIAFRGLLLHGLRRRLHPVALCLVVGGIFGLFHVSLFRLVPTAYMGALLAAVVVITGSILPAMLWHALNNATALVPSVLGWFPQDMELAWWWSVVGVVGLAVAFGLLWVNRSVYPGLRGSSSSSR